jgi:curved DNA-binding protein CbpA
MSFRIEKGLFALDFTDQHAILGMSLDAEVKEIRKRYLSIARRLHPDSLTSATPEQKKEANQLLSKLVNPAYEVLSQEKNRAEYALLLKLKGQQAIQQKLSLNDFNDTAKLLAKTNNVDHVYRQSLVTLNEGLYDDIATIEEKINALSELNLVYAMRKAAAGGRPGPAPAPTTGIPAASATPTNSGATAATAAAANSSASMSSTTVPSATTVSPIDNYLRRAEAYITKKAFSQAILELRDAIRVAPNDSRCHSLMGVVYLAQGQAAMSRSYIRRALELNPEDQRANACKKRLESMGHSLDSASTATPGNGKNASGKSSNGDDKSNRGLFGGLFGGKKKS